MNIKNVKQEDIDLDSEMQIKRHKECKTCRESPFDIQGHILEKIKEKVEKEQRQIESRGIKWLCLECADTFGLTPDFKNIIIFFFRRSGICNVCQRKSNVTKASEFIKKEN